jgi:hypothetical protein
LGNRSQVYVYELTTQPRAATRATVGEVCVAVLNNHRDADLHAWTVAATLEQAANFQKLRWVNKPRQLGLMDQVGNELVFRYLLTGDTWKVPIDALGS